MGTNNRLTPNTYGILLASISVPNLITRSTGGLDLGAAKTLFNNLDWSVLDPVKIDVPGFLKACDTVKQVVLKLDGCNNPPCLGITIAQITVANAMAMMNLFPDIAKKLNLTRRSAKRTKAQKKKKAQTPK